MMAELAQMRAGTGESPDGEAPLPTQQGAAGANVGNQHGANHGAANGKQVLNEMQVPMLNQHGGADQQWADRWQSMFSMVMEANKRKFEEMVRDWNTAEMMRIADARLGRATQLRTDMSAWCSRRTSECEI